MMVDHRCDDCRYFGQGSLEPTSAKHVWGDCMKSKEHSGDTQDTEARRSFRWADNSCDDFEPRAMALDR